MMELLKLSREVVLIAPLSGDRLRDVADKLSSLEGRRTEERDEKDFFVARLARGLDAMVLSKLQNEWCLSRAYIKSSCHPAEMAGGRAIEEVEEFEELKE
jgi:hypothetical protein